MTHHAGRHFLQIPGPTNVPDRVLRAIDRPTIDHRGPEFAELGKEVLAGIKRSSRPTAPVVIYPASGTGAWEAALVNTLSPGRSGADVRDRPFRRRCGARWPAARARRRSSCPATGATAPIPRRSRRACAEDAAHAIKAVCVVHNETSTGVTSGIAEVRAAIDRAGHPALLMVDTISSLASIDYRHDEWGVDVTVGGSQKGLMLPPGLSLQRGLGDKALAAREDREAAAVLLGLGRDARAPTQTASSPTRRRPTCSTACARRSRCCEEEGLDERVRAPRRARRGDAARGARAGASRSCAATRREYSSSLTAVLMPDGPRRRRVPQGRARALQHVARHRPGQAAGQGVPHRPPRRLQRSDAGRHAGGGRDGAGARRRAGRGERRRRGARLSGAPGLVEAGPASAA